MGADTLVHICQRTAGRFQAGLESVSDLPWELVKPIIMKVDSPERLVSLDLTASETNLTMRRLGSRKTPLKFWVMMKKLG